MIVVSLLMILVSGGLLVGGILRADDVLVMASIGVSVLAAGALFLGIRQQRDAMANRADWGAEPQVLPRRHASSESAGAASAPPAGPTASRGDLPRSGAAGPDPARPDPARPDAARSPEPEAQRWPPSTVPARGSVPAVDTRPGAGSPAGEASAAAADAAPRNGSGGPAGGRAVPSNGGGPTEAPGPDQRADHGPGAGADVEPLDDDVDVDDPPDEPAAELLMASEVSRLAGMDDEVLVVDGRPRYHLRDCPHLADKPAQGLPVSEAVELGFTACSRCGAATALLAEASQR
jgi:hypothetical protein